MQASSTKRLSSFPIDNLMMRLLFSRFRFCQASEVIPTEGRRSSKFELKNFADHLKLKVSGGNGGNGILTFYSDKKVRYGAPDGGDGGQGGDIVLQAHSAMHDLSHLRMRTVEGVDGQNGGATGRQGKNGGKTLLRVPCGTLVFELRSEEDRESKHFLADLSSDKLSLIVAKGGAAGKGNKTHPRMKEEDRFGHPGQTKTIYLELKTLADIGLVGFPNVGKSTFLAATTRALPKIANYEFTTLKPSVGRVKFVDDYYMSIADIPGIIEDAHNNKGLGFEFLRHIERTQVLLFVVDITHPDPLQQYRILEQELAAYGEKTFEDRKRVVVFNKADCLEKSREKYEIFSRGLAVPSFLVSAKEGEGVGEVLVHLRSLKEGLDKKKNEEAERKRLEEEMISKRQ